MRDLFPIRGGPVTRRLLLIAALVLASASVATAHPDQAPSKGHPATKDGLAVTHHVHRFHKLIRSAYAPERWDVGPKRHDIRKAQKHKRAVRIAKTRDQLSDYRTKRRRLFEQYRASQQALAEITPYDCGSRGHAAIPCYVVECESHFDWGAVNPSSGAFGWYQLLPSTYSGVCESCDRSEYDQHLAASRVWARSGGSEWSCA